MFSAKTLIASAAALAFVLPSQVSAHGSIAVPKVTFLDPPNRHAPSASMSGPAGPYTGNAVVKELADSHGSKCGKTDPNGAVQPIPADGYVQLQITAAHIGPCELWLDGEMVASAKQCVKEYPDRKIKVDFSKCKSSKCQLRWVWLATHNSPWEIYDNCVTVGGGSSDGGDSPAVTPSVTPGPTTHKPSSQKPTTQKPSKAPRPTKAPVTTEPPASDNDDADNTDETDGDEPATVSPGGGDDASKYRGIDNSPALNWWCSINCERGFCPKEVCVERA